MYSFCSPAAPSAAIAAEVTLRGCTLLSVYGRHALNTILLGLEDGHALNPVQVNFRCRAARTNPLSGRLDLCQSVILYASSMRTLSRLSIACLSVEKKRFTSSLSGYTLHPFLFFRFDIECPAVPCHPESLHGIETDLVRLFDGPDETSSVERVQRAVLSTGPMSLTSRQSNVIGSVPQSTIVIIKMYLLDSLFLQRPFDTSFVHARNLVISVSVEAPAGRMTSADLFCRSTTRTILFASLSDGGRFRSPRNNAWASAPAWSRSAACCASWHIRFSHLRSALRMTSSALFTSLSSASVRMDSP